MAIPNIPQMLTIPEAAQRYHVPIDQLQLSITSGKIKAAMLNDMILVSEVDIMADLPKEARPEYLKHAHLKGVPITIREAGRKYDISVSTLSRWVGHGYIATIQRVGNRLMVDEADVAYCCEVYRQRPGQGIWLFNPDGTPYTHK